MPEIDLGSEASFDEILDAHGECEATSQGFQSNKDAESSIIEDGTGRARYQISPKETNNHNENNEKSPPPYSSPRSHPVNSRIQSSVYMSPTIVSTEKKMIGKYDGLSPVRQSRDARRPWRINNQPPQKRTPNPPAPRTPSNNSLTSESNRPSSVPTDRMKSACVTNPQQSTEVQSAAKNRGRISGHKKKKRKQSAGKGGERPGVTQTPIIISTPSPIHATRAASRPASAKLTRKELLRQPDLVQVYGTPAQQRFTRKFSSRKSQTGGSSVLRVHIPKSTSHAIPHPPNPDQQQQQRTTYRSPRRSPSPRRAPLQDKVVDNLRKACAHGRHRERPTVTVSRDELAYVLDICDIQHRVVRSRYAEDQEMLQQLGESLQDTGTRVLKQMQPHRHRLTGKEHESEEERSSVVKARMFANRALAAASMAQTEREPASSVLPRVMIQHIDISNGLLAAYAMAAKETEKAAIDRITSLWDELEELKNNDNINAR